MERVDHPDAHRGEPMTALEPDHVLAGRALHDRAAYAELYRAVPHCRSMAIATGDWAVAKRPKSATSLVFTKALEGLPTVRTANTRAWLFTIAHHVVADSYRRNRSDVELELAAEVAVARPAR